MVLAVGLWPAMQLHNSIERKTKSASFPLSRVVVIIERMQKMDKLRLCLFVNLFCFRCRRFDYCR